MTGCEGSCRGGKLRVRGIAVPLREGVTVPHYSTSVRKVLLRDVKGCIYKIPDLFACFPC